MATIKSFKIWNTHYQAKGDNWKVTLFFLDGHQFTTIGIMTMAEATAYITMRYTG